MDFKDILRVWGTADSFDLNCKKTEDGTWQVQVPADLEDGTYAVDLFAQNRIGKVGHWTGMLYMHQGRACMHLDKQKFILWLYVPEYRIKARTSTEIKFVRSCKHCRGY